LLGLDPALLGFNVQTYVSGGWVGRATKYHLGLVDVTPLISSVIAVSGVVVATVVVIALVDRIADSLEGDGKIRLARVSSSHGSMLFFQKQKRFPCGLQHLGRDRPVTMFAPLCTPKPTTVQRETRLIIAQPDPQ